MLIRCVLLNKMNFIKYIFIISIFISSCSGNKKSDPDVVGSSETEMTAAESNVIQPDKNKQDSLIIWVSNDFKRLLSEDISICDCWKETKYHLMYFDTTKMELYLKSNLMHYGHDSDLIFPLRKTGNTFRYDSTLNNWTEQPKEFTLPTNNTLTLLDGDKTYTFSKRVFKYAKDRSKNHFSVYSNLKNIFYWLNSGILLKYDVVDTLKSTHDLITIEKLQEFINLNKVSAHCSDDYNLDGITIKENENRYFQLVFGQGEVTLYQNKGRNRYEKLDLDSLPRQVLRVK